MATVRKDGKPRGSSESPQEFVRRFVGSAQCDDLVVEKTKKGQRLVHIGNASFLSDSTIPVGAPDRQVQLWTAAKALYAATVALLELAEPDLDRDAQAAERVAAKCWARMYDA